LWRVDWLIPCRYCEVNNGLATIIGGGFDTEGGHEFPGPAQVTLAIRLLGLPDDRSHNLTVKVEDPGLQEVGAPLHFPFTAAKEPQHLPGWEINIVLTALVLFTATDEGSYTITADVDGQGSRSVVLRLLPPATPD
jgi:hypothetical protein